MTPDEYAAWLADCIKANICTYHRVRNCGCYYWTGVKETEMDISQKVAYVKQQSQFRPHHCHWPGCEAQVPPAMWGCKSHWFKLPKHLRNAIWSAYRPGQEADMSPSREYVDAAELAQQWIREQSA